MVSAGSAEQSEQVLEQPQQSEWPRVRFRTQPITVLYRVDWKPGEDQSGTVSAQVGVGTGLAIHRSLHNGGPKPRGDWTVTHVRSGRLVVAGLPSERAARLAVERLLQLPIDWHADAETVRKAADASVTVRQALWELWESWCYRRRREQTSAKGVG